jgi:hypothetical protein
MTRTLLTLTFLLAGCGGPDGPELATVTGRVTVDTSPVAGAVITFLPDGSGSPSYGRTDADGRYELMFTFTKSGAMVGKHSVEIETRKIPPAEADEMRAGGLEVPVFQEIPKSYRTPGALTAEVRPGHNEIDFNLVSR